MELDSSVERANLQAAQAQLSALRQTYQRYVGLLNSNAVSRQEMDNAKAAYDAQVASIESLKAAIERRKIVAPFDGKAGIVKINVGQYVNVGTEIVRVEDTSSMKVDFALSQNDLDKLHIGQRVTATTDARLGETFSARITAIEPAINSSTGLVDVQATFDPEDGHKLLSGMFSRLRIALPTETNQVVVPQVAISYNMYGEIAYLLEPLSEEEKGKMSGNEKLIVSIVRNRSPYLLKIVKVFMLNYREMKLKWEIKLLQAVSKVLVMEVLWNGLKRHCGCNRACT